MLGKKLIKSNDAGGAGACTNTVDLYNPFPDGGGLALYQLNGDATDVSGNYDGTATNVSYGAGQFGQAGVFNGSNSYVNMGDPAALRLLGSYSISFWVNFNSASGIQRIINKDNANDYSGGYSVYTNGTSFEVVHSNGSYNGFAVSNAFTTGVWYNFIVTFDSSNNSLKAYKNSIEIASTTTSGSLTNSGDSLFFGAYGQSSPIGQWFNGSLDQVRFFNRALRPYEVEALYTEEYCTPTIVPSEHFNTVLYTGNNTGQSITGVGFQPDLVWIKTRDRGYPFTHRLTDSVRGATKQLSSDTTDAESIENGVLSFNSDGFTLGDSAGFNISPDNFVAWNFKAGGAAVTNTDGTITSQVSANTEAGFSVVSYTGNLTASTVGHGLNNTPSIYIVKSRDNTSNWFVYSSSIGNTKYLNLDSTIAASTFNVWNNTDPNDSVFSLAGQGDVNANGLRYIAYCFAEVEGFSSFGSFVGTGTSVNVITGFEPAFVIWKNISQGSASYDYWFTVDNKRSPENPIKKVLYPNDSSAESTTTYDIANFYENGFQIVGNQGGNRVFNNAGDTYIYMAFAADPTAVEPTLEDSFNTVTYTGNFSTNSITGVGFQPDLVWGKLRNFANAHLLFDSVRGVGNYLVPNLTDAEGFYAPTLTSFDSDGFTLGADNTINKTGYNAVAWAWKGAEIPAINSNGSIPSVVSANPAAGFSIVSYTGNQLSNQTIGHGLGKTPDMIITKGRTNLSLYDQWDVWHKDLTLNYILSLQSTAAEGFAGVDQRFVTSLNSDTVFGVGWDDFGPNSNGTTKIAYCFAEVPGFSKFGSYTGTGAAGNFQDCGFEPAFVMIKCTSNTMNWAIFDNKRDTTNPNEAILYPNLSLAETNSAGSGINFLANGFELDTTSGGWINTSGYSFIYMAFANQF